MFHNPFEYKKPFVLFLFLFAFTCITAQVITGAEQLDKYLPLLKNKRVVLAVNPTSMIRDMHLADSLRKLNVKITAIFAPEHGFRGNAEAGALIKSGVDKKSGLTVISLYGKHKKPTAQDLSKADIVVFDMQDVGARFYTYISTLHYIMEACAENNKPLLVLDRPNPNGFYVDGPVLDPKFSSFVGMHPVPIAHGMTIGEYAQMINGEGWLNKGMACKLTVIKAKNYDHNTRYVLPVKPSPNLPTMESVYLYPSLCLFEGTDFSLGRGTSTPFECVGKPGLKNGTYTFTPRPIKGIADNPPHVNKVCKGFLLTPFAKNVFPSNPRIHLTWLIDLYQQDTAQATFFTPFFDKLAGTDQLRLQIMAGKSEDEIRKSWQADLRKFRDIRLKYLLYKDFDVIYSSEK